MIMDGSCLFHLCVTFSIVVVAFCEGNRIFATDGENKVIKLIITPAPGDVLVDVLHPSEEIMYTTLRTIILPGSGNIARRVTNTSNTNTNTGHIEFTLNDVRVTDSGYYKSRFTPPGVDLVTVSPVGAVLIVYVKPAKPVVAVITTPVLGQFMVLQCTASSSSKPEGQLAMKYKWYMNNVELLGNGRYFTTSTQLHIYIQKSDNDSTFTCQGYETSSLLSETSDGYTPDVKYGPIVVTLSPSISSFTLVEFAKNTLGPITCVAGCFPACTYQWSRDGTDISSAASLGIFNATRADDGTYTCDAKNSIGNQESVLVRVIVEYGPVVIALSPDTVNFTKEQNSDISPITCVADCNPSCTYQWTLHGDNVGGQSSKLNIKDKQTGSYTCTAKNDHGTRISQNISITVAYELITSHPNDQSMCKAGIAMVITGVVSLLISLALTFYNIRRMRFQEEMKGRSETTQTQFDVQLEQENAGYTELDQSRTNVYEDIGETENVYESL